MGKVKFVDVNALLSSSELRPTEISGDVPLFDLASSELLLRLCESLGIGVLGIEGFTLEGDGIRPDLDYIADFSQLLSRADFLSDSIEGARNFLQSAIEKPSLRFEYVLAKIDTSEIVGERD